MRLLIDVGNTRLKWTLDGARGLGEVGAVDHGGRPERVLPELAGPPEELWIAQVFGPGHEAPLVAAARQRYGLVPSFARSQARCGGLSLAYAEPARLGVDRWLMMLALWHERPEALCVVGAGTALTLDAVDDRGQHLGGFIAAGLATHEQATLGKTRFDTRAFDVSPGAGLGRDTESCVRQGAVLACLGAIDRGWRAGGAPARRVIAGGDGATLQALLDGGWQLRPNLVLEGLAALAGLEQQSAT